MTISDEDIENDLYDLAYKVIKKNRELMKRIKQLEAENLKLIGEQLGFELNKTTKGQYPPYTIGPAINTNPFGEAKNWEQINKITDDK